MATVREQFIEQTKKEKEERQKLEEQEEPKETYVYSIYQCTNCFNFIDETKPPHKPLMKDLKACPFCHKTKKSGLFKKVTKAEMIKYKNKCEIKEEKEKASEELKIDSTLKSIRKDIEKDTLQFANELNMDLGLGKVSPQNFVAIFINISAKIAESRIKAEGRYEYIIDWCDYKRAMIDMCQTMTQANDFKVDCQQIYEDYEWETLNENDVYISYNEKYLQQDEYALKRHELGQRVMLTQKEEELNSLEKQAQKATQRVKKIDENAFEKMLKSGVNKAN